MTYRYREFPVPGIFHFFGGIGTRIGTNLVPGISLGTGIRKISCRNKNSEPVSEKFDTRTDFCRQNLGNLKIYNGYWYRKGTGTRIFSSFLVVSEPVWEKFGTGKSLGTSIGKIWYRKNVSEPVSEKFGIKKSTGIGIGNIWYRKKSIGIGIV